MLDWGYTSDLKVSSGYEDFEIELKKYNRDLYLESSNDEKAKIIEEVFKIYRFTD